LDDDRFEVRERATKELTQLGELAVPTLRQTLQITRSAEVRWRIERLLQQFDKPGPTGEALRSLRAVAVLEHIGTAEAQEVLRTLANSAAEARLTQEAKASLERLTKRAAQRP
jgi:thioredoxin-like negative regulator of GroEL